MKKIALLGIVAIIVLSVYGVYAQGGNSEDKGQTSGNVAGFVGTVCFKLDNYADTWKLSFDQIGPSYQVTGTDLGYKAMACGGAVSTTGDLRLTLVETNADSSNRAIHGISLNAQTLTGTTDFAWLTPEGNLWTGPFINEPFHKVTCGAVANDNKPASEDK